MEQQPSCILVYLETSGAALAPASLELLGTAFHLAQGIRLSVSALLAGEDPALFRAQLAAWPLQRVLFYPVAGPFRSDLFGQLLHDAIVLLDPEILLIAATPEGRSIAPYAAAKCRAGLTADCTELFLEPPATLLQRRPAYGGNRMAEIVTSRRPQMATVRPGAFPRSAPPEQDVSTRWETRSGPWESVILVQEARRSSSFDSLREARRIVAIGRGIGSREAIPAIAALAKGLGAVLAGSRALIELGWLPSELQIGLSGQAVAPDWLLTLGISGSIQFRAGIRQAKQLIAVNSDPDAPILRSADIPICADLHNVTQALSQALSRRGQRR